MPQDLLRDGLAWLTNQMQEHASRPIVYVREGQRIEMRATFGSRMLRVEDGDGGIRLEWADLDFVIRASDLTIGEVLIEPERGDQIIVVEPEGDHYYEVRAFGGDSPWRWADPHRSAIRVHTKHVETELPG